MGALGPGRLATVEVAGAMARNDVEITAGNPDNPLDMPIYLRYHRSPIDAIFAGTTRAGDNPPQ